MSASSVPAARPIVRAAAAAVFLLFVNPSVVFAQETEFLVTVASATIHQGPSTGSPVVGVATRGDVLSVTRELGSWVRIAWPEAADGVGYVHVSRGQSRSSRAASGAGLAPARHTGPGVPATSERAGQASGPGAYQPAEPRYVVLPTHVVGLGALTGGSTFGSGASARTWFHDRLAFQFDLSRSSFTSPAAPGSLTATQFAPSALYSFADYVTNDVWVRPYVGGGPRWARQTIGFGPGAGGASVSGSSTGLQVFGGAEVTLARVPRLALSADLRRGWIGEPVSGFDLDGFGFSVAGHWYVK